MYELVPAPRAAAEVTVRVVSLLLYVPPSAIVEEVPAGSISVIEVAAA